jgi:hypothetical protein
MFSQPVSCVDNTHTLICKPVSIYIALTTCEQYRSVQKYKTFTDRGCNTCWILWYCAYDVHPASLDDLLCSQAGRVTAILGVRLPQATEVLNEFDEIL